MNKRTLIRLLQILAGIAIMGAGLYLFFKKVDISRLGWELLSGNPLIYLLCCALALFSLWLRALRWHLMLPDTPQTHKKGLFGQVMISFMANNILPARMGEAFRVVLLWRKNGYSPLTAFSALVLERFLDLFTFITYFTLPVFLLPELSNLLPLARILTVWSVGFVVVLTFFALWPRTARAVTIGWTQKVPERLRGKFTRRAQDVIANLDWLTDVKKTAAIAVLSFGTTLSYAAILFLLANQFQAFSVLQSVFSQAYAAFGAAIPLSPGYVGTLHAILLQGLTTAGMDPSVGGAVTLLYHAVCYVPITLVGLFFYFRTDMSFKEMTSASYQAKELQKNAETGTSV